MAGVAAVGANLQTRDTQPDQAFSSLEEKRPICDATGELPRP